MAKWICKVCGYVHNGDAAPETCPQCGAPRARFNQEGKNKGCASCILLFLISLATFTYLSCRSSTTVDNSTVKNLELSKYLGKWYEIARFDHKFERDMTHCTATYSQNDDGTISITNQGKKKGKWKTSKGKAKVTEVPGLLRVSFFGPFYSDYRILMLAPDYSHVLIGGSDDDYLWILSRTPQLDHGTRNKLLSEAQRRGYKTDNLIWVKQ